MIRNLILPLAWLSLVTTTAPAATVRAPAGPMAGKTVGQQGDVEAFLGIPFAQPPVGPLRWREPQPLKPWTEVRRCTDFGPSCPQPKSLLAAGTERQSEDCLYLNVWRPAKASGKPLPVMVWIHGGGLTTGSGSKSIYDGEAFAREGVVLVTINYRLGPFGFLAHPAPSKESSRGISGNYGLLDQIAALRWVKENIGALGGDPDNVTIFGESAGGLSVSCLLVSPLSKGLFHRAIIESATAESVATPLRSNGPDVDSGESQGRELAAAMGIEGDGAEAAAAMREKSADDLLTAIRPRVGLFGPGTKYRPAIDGYVLPEPPRMLVAAGRFHNVPVMIGTTADEGTLFTSHQLPIRRALGYRWLLRKAFGDNAGEVEAMFPAAAAENVPEQIARVVTISCFTAPARRLARNLAEKGESPVYLYYFSRVCPGLAEKELGATHGSEIFYIFGTAPPPLQFTDVDRKLAETMRKSWVRFAQSGNPNGAGLPTWPPYSSAAQKHLEWGDTVRVGADLCRKECDLFDRVGLFAGAEQAD